MTTVRAKLKVHSVAVGGDHASVHMQAVYSNDPTSENKSFTDYTPSANLTIAIQKDKPAAAFFSVGKEYYLDFTEAAAT